VQNSLQELVLEYLRLCTVDLNSCGVKLDRRWLNFLLGLLCITLCFFLLSLFSFNFLSLTIILGDFVCFLFRNCICYVFFAIFILLGILILMLVLLMLLVMLFALFRRAFHPFSRFLITLR
jgi:hypothetical protein